MSLIDTFTERFGSGPDRERARRLIRATSGADVLMAALTFDGIHEDARGAVQAYQALCLQLAHELEERDQ